MKQLHVLLAVTFVLPHLCSAQYLAENNSGSNISAHPVSGSTHSNSGASPRPASVTAQWEKEEDQVNGRINSGKLSKMKTAAEGIISCFQDSSLAGDRYHPSWFGEYFSEKTSPTEQITFSIHCNFYEQKAQLIILSNDLSPLLDHVVMNHQDFLAIIPPHASRNEDPYFESTSKIAGEAGTTPSTQSKFWLVTTGKQLLYTPVTRKEYLTEARQELTNRKNNILAAWRQKVPVHSAAVQEVEKKVALEQLAIQYSGVELQTRTRMFLSHYQTDEEYLKENTDKETVGIDYTLRLMDSLISHLPSSELSKPATVAAETADFQGFGDGPTDKMLVRINTSYFNPGLSAEKPQFFLVCWQYAPSVTDAEDIDLQIQDRLPLANLKGMLGK